MDRLIGRPQVAPLPRIPERRRTAAAWEALERAEVLLPADHPAAWHLAQALAAMEAEWREHSTGGGRVAPLPC